VKKIFGFTIRANLITQDILNMADLRVTIPMEGTTSSLNVGVAAGIAMFEKTRQEKNR
jgi:tRNA G18 (ribose-2'-O)-methylase SpoU